MLRRWKKRRELRALAGGEGPKPPEGVVAILDDGREVPVDCVYVGQDEDGIHIWQAAWEIAGTPVGMRAQVMPARTAIGLSFNMPGDPL